MSVTVLTVQPQKLSTLRDKAYDWFNFYGNNANSEEDILSFESFIELMNLYNLETKSICGDNPTAMATSGGFQQYLIRKQMEGSGVDAVQPVKGLGSDALTFHNLPDSVQLHIFSYLGSKDLCTISAVCTHWAVLACDDLLWQRRLMTDVHKWKTISQSTNPDMYKECQSDLHNKEIYLRCCPEVNAYMKNQSLTLHSLSNYFKSFLPKKIPKIAMFGPGMETSTSGIVRKIIEDKTDLFHVTGMFPGRIRGLGSGFTIKVDNSTTMNFTPLYSNTKEERENRTVQQRLQSSRFFKQQKQNEEQDTENSDEFETFPITTEMKELLRSLDGYTFAVEASITEQSGIEMARSELFSMINDQWCNPTAPIIILACTLTRSTPRLSNMELVRNLSLGKFNRPWQIHSIAVDTMKETVPALEWLIERCQRN